jgi:L-asparaginase/Glu-tRNA(Gln) amidotransferase subunit D
LRELNGINSENGSRHQASRQAVSPGTAPELGAADDDALVSGAPVDISISELARRIGSSRTHVIKLLNDAAADGLVVRSSGNGIVLQPRLSEAVHEFFAIGYLFLAHCAKATREGHVGRPERGWPANPARS